MQGCRPSRPSGQRPKSMPVRLAATNLGSAQPSLCMHLQRPESAWDPAKTQIRRTKTQKVHHRQTSDDPAAAWRLCSSFLWPCTAMWPCIWPFSWPCMPGAYCFMCVLQEPAVHGTWIRTPLRQEWVAGQHPATTGTWLLPALLNQVHIARRVCPGLGAAPPAGGSTPVRRSALVTLPACGPQLPALLPFPRGGSG